MTAVQSPLVVNYRPSVLNRAPRVQWSLRAMLVATTLCALASAWIASAAQEKKREDAIVASLAGHCAVSYCSLLPRWAVRLGADFSAFERVDAAVLAEPQVWAIERLVQFQHLVSIAVRHLDDESAELVGRIQTLRTIASTYDALQTSEGRSQALTDRGALHISRLKRLERLSLINSQVGDAGVLALSQSRNLRELRLPRSLITDACARCIAKMPHLEKIDLSGCRVTDTGLCALSRSRSLHSIAVGQTRVGDAGLRCLAASRAAALLSEFDVDQTKVTDAGVKALKACRGLTTLRLAETWITDRSVAVFRSLPHLFWIDVQGCDLSHKALGEIAVLRDARAALENPPWSKQRLTNHRMTAKEMVGQFFPRRMWEDR